MRYVLLIIAIFLGQQLKSQSVNSADSLKKLLLHEKVDSIRYDIYQKLFNTYRFIDLDSALYYVDKQSELAKFSGNENKIASTLKNRGIIAWSKGEQFDAFTYFTDALKTFKKNNDLFGIASCTNNIGLLHLDHSNFKEALKYFIKALEQMEKLGDEHRVAIVSNNVAVIFIELEDYDKGKYYLTKALDFHKKNNQQRDIAVCYSNFGIIEQNTQNYKEAIKYYQKAYDINETLKFDRNQIKLIANIGSAYSNMKEYNKSLEYLFEAVELAISLDEELKNDWIYSNIGANYYELGEYRKALKYSQKGFILAEKNTNRKNMTQALEIISNANEKLGNYKMALAKYRLLKQINDSIYNEKSRLEINRLEMQHEFDNKIEQAELKRIQEQKRLTNNLARQKQSLYFVIIGAIMLIVVVILLTINSRIKRTNNNKLKEKNEEIKSQAEEINVQNQILLERNEEIEKLSQAKDKIFSIIGHDLRNVVGTTANSLDFLAGNNNVDNNASNILLKELRDNSKRVFTMLENLLSWGKSQINESKINKQPFTLSEPISETIKFLQSNAEKKGIVLKTELDSNCKVFADKESIKMVIRNLISNAIKFTEPEGCVIVRTEANRDSIRTLVIDNGVGMTRSQIEDIMDYSKFNTTFGTLQEKGTGLGLNLSIDYLKKNNSELKVVSEPRKGTEFYFNLPLAT